MIINGQSLLKLAPIKDMIDHKVNLNGVSYGLGEAGYDIRLRQDVKFEVDWRGRPSIQVFQDQEPIHSALSRFTLASAIEEFQMPTCLVGEVKDKSSWARQGLSVFNTVIESGWKGKLTLELVFHGSKPVYIPAGSGIAQVVFYKTSDDASYEGKYQNQEDRPVETIWAKNEGS